MRPINKRNFGATAGRLAVRFHDGSSVRTGWVLAQVGTSRYRITDGNTTKFATLCQTADQVTALLNGTGPAASMRGNLCTIEITPHGGSVENVRKLTRTQAFTVQGSFVTWALGVASTRAGEGTIAVTNRNPVVANPIADQSFVIDTAWSFQFPANTFSDPENGTLTYTATLANGDPLPAEITFTAGTRTFSAAADAFSTAQTFQIRVTATDNGTPARSAFDDFTVTANEPV